jgi:hypothetical protein
VDMDKNTDTTKATDAVIRFEVATDEYNADQFRQSRMRHGSRPTAWGPAIARQLQQEVQEAAVAVLDARSKVR